MIKRILTLMTFTAFLAPTTGFCMDKDENPLVNPRIQKEYPKKLVDLEILETESREEEKNRISLEFVFLYNDLLSMNVDDVVSVSLILEEEEDKRKPYIFLDYFKINVKKSDRVFTETKTLFFPKSIKTGTFFAIDTGIDDEIVCEPNVINCYYASDEKGLSYPSEPPSPSEIFDGAHFKLEIKQSISLRTLPDSKKSFPYKTSSGSISIKNPDSK